MKKLLLAVAATGLLMSANIAMADNDCVVQGKAVPVSQIQQSIQTMGYSSSKSIKLNDSCVYKAKVKDTSGHAWKLFFDPITGQLIGKEQEAWYD